MAEVARMKAIPVIIEFPTQLLHATIRQRTDLHSTKRERTDAPEDRREGLADYLENGVGNLVWHLDQRVQ
jgi:hypothetical protein